METTVLDDLKGQHQEKTALLISRCLLGEPCRYDGRSKGLDAELLDALRERYELIPVCPEEDGGLPTPRMPSEIRGGKVLMNMNGQGSELQRENSLKIEADIIDGLKDVTQYYQRGAELALEAAVAKGAVLALLKTKSPSCGCGRVYDGSFSGTLTEGDGIAADLLKKNGIKVIPSDLLEELMGARPL